MDTQQYFMGLSSRFTDFRKSNFLYDTILCVGEREFRVHGFLLASASKFFESLLQQYDKPEMKCIKLPRLDSNIMAIILDYIYTGKLFLPFNEETQKFEMPPNLIETFTELGIDLMEVDGHINILTYRREEDFSFATAETKAEPLVTAFESADIVLENSQYVEEMPSNHLATNLFAAQENYSNVLQHQMSGDLKPVVCLDCGLAFNGMAEREEHRKQMHPMKGYLCNDCGEQFVSEAELVDHVSSVHFDSYETKSEMFPCKMCERTYTTRAALQLHNCPARKPMTFICAICNKGFQYKSQLTSHMRTHSGERPFGCDQCGKKFAATLNLVQHLRTHTGERPFACDKCSKTFTQRSHLLTHLRTHTGEKPFKCGYCAKAYKNRLDLRIHCNNKHGVDIRVREANHPNSAKRGFLA